jgi:hypothetical protein
MRSHIDHPHPRGYHPPPPPTGEHPLSQLLPSPQCRNQAKSRMNTKDSAN